MTAPTPPKNDWVDKDTAGHPPTDWSVGAAAQNTIAANINYLLSQNAGKQPSNALLTAISSLVDPNTDKLIFWDDSASTLTYLGLGTNLSITGTTLNATGGGAGGATNLTTTQTTTDVTVVSDTGSDATIPAATGTLAGTMTAADRVKFATIATSADVTNTTTVAAAGAVMTSTKNVPNGVLGLNASGLANPAQLPSYVDDVLEYVNFAAFPGTGETGKIYVAINNPPTTPSTEWRWSGTVYVQMVSSPGTTDAVTEGTTNLYYTNARADARIAAGITGKQALNANLTSISTLVDPNADRIAFWDDSAGAWAFLTLGTNLSITGTTLNATGTGGESGIGPVTVSGTPTAGQVPTALTGTTAAWATPGAVAADPSFPESYGAVGDGTTNDTTAMQNWLNWVKVGGRTGYLYPGKTYRIVSPLLWNTAGPIYHAHIDGQGATLLMATNDTSHIRVTEEFIMNCSIRNIRFDYVNQQTAATGKACIVFDTATTLGFGWFDWMFEHLTFMQRCNKGIENTETGVNAVWGSTFRHLFSEYGTTGSTCKIRSGSAGMPNNWYDHIYQNRNSNPAPTLDLSFQTCGRITNFEVNESAMGGPDLRADFCWGLSMDTVRTENGVNSTGDAIYLFSESRQVSVDNWQIINRPFANTGYVFRGTNTSILSIGPGLIDTYSGAVTGANCTVVSLDGTSKLTRYEQVSRPAAVVDGSSITTGTTTYTGSGSNANRMVTAAILPAPGTSGNVATSNGSIWTSAAPPTGTLPSQTGQSGKFLTTNGTTPSWAPGTGGGEFINVKRDYSATGNGSTDDAPAIQNALTAAGAAGGGLVYVPPGVYRLNTTLTIPANVELRGAGEEATQLIKYNDHIMLDISGTATGWANHTRFQRVCDMTLIGEMTTGALIRSYYADNMRFDNLLLSYNNDKGFDLVEVYDSFFNAVTADTVSGSDGTKPTVHIRCSAAASGFGFGADDSNMLWFVNCHFENYGDGAIWIEAGQGSSTPNGIWFTHLKCESSNMAGGPVIKVGPTAMNIHFKDVYMYGNGFLSGFGTPIPAIVASGSTLTTYRDMWIAGGPTSSFSNAIAYTGNGGGQHVFDGIRWNGGGAALTGAVLNFIGGTADVEVGAITANDSSTLFGGTPPNQFTGTRPLRRVAGAVSDASFLKPPLPGTMALDTTNNRLYIRAGSTWRYATLT